MQSSTHAAIGLFTGVTIAIAYQTNLSGIILYGLVGAAAAQLPDRLEMNILPHRKPTHSLFSWAALHAMLALLLPSNLFMQVTSIAYLSHIAADAMTVQGVWFLYPLPYRLWILPKGGRMRTGSHVDSLLGLLISIACVAVVMRYFYR